METQVHTPTTACGPIADVFSSYVVATALSSAYELAFLDAIQVAEGAVDIVEFAGIDLDADVLISIAQTLSWAGIVQINGKKVARGERFAEAYAARGYFYWLVRGCGELFTVAPSVAQSEKRHGDFFRRDMRAVAVGSRLIGDIEVEPLFDRTLAELGTTTVVDLGCGSGNRLIRIAQRNPGMRGIGIDLAPAAVKLARESVRNAGLADRISVFEADALNLPEIPGSAEVDVVTCVFMGHDFWPIDKCVPGLVNLRKSFPNVRRFLLCDVVKGEFADAEVTPIFTLGFEHIHALMDVYLPTRQEWFVAFEAAGWDVVRTRDTTNPPGGILFELAPAR